MQAINESSRRAIERYMLSTVLFLLVVLAMVASANAQSGAQTDLANQPSPDELLPVPTPTSVKIKINQKKTVARAPQAPQKAPQNKLKKAPQKAPQKVARKAPQKALQKKKIAKRAPQKGRKQVQRVTFAPQRTQVVTQPILVQPVVVQAAAPQAPQAPIQVTVTNPPAATTTAPVAQSSSARARSNHALIPSAFIGQSEGFFANNYGSQEIERRTLAGGGILYEYGGQHTLSFQTGLLYIPTGYTVTGQTYTSGAVGFGPLTQYSRVTKVDYVGVPALAKLNFPITSRLTATIKGGVIPITPIAATTSSTAYTSGGVGGTQSSTTNSIDDVRNFNVIGEVGAGLQMPISGLYDIRAEGIYDRLTMPIYKDNPIETYTQSFSFMLGFGMKL